jgi:hypothetical protein
MKASTGAARGGAPTDESVDDTRYVQSERGEIYEGVSDGSMPPTGKLSAETIESIPVYLACNAR